MKIMWKEQKKKVLYFLYTLSTLGYMSAFTLFIIAYPYDVFFKWNSYYNEIMQIMPGVLFILGMVCAEISGFLTISERNCVIEEKERIWTEKERIETEKLLLKLDD